MGIGESFKKEEAMTARILCTLCFVLLMVMAPTLLAQGKGGGKCVNVPIRVTLLPLPTGGSASVLRGDGTDTYQDGQSGVTARINFCSGSRDATITTQAKTSTRKIRISFPEPLADTSLSGQTPSWAGAGIEIEVGFFFNIRNILCHSGSCGDTFTTRMNWQFAGPDGRDYRWRFYPAMADSPDLHSPDMLLDEPDINEPYETSYVLVHHRPGNCGVSGGAPVVYDQWDVTAANPNNPEGFLQLGTLHRSPKGPNDTILHMGQYSMPYRLQVEALQCF